MILEATYVASFDSDSLCLISGFCEMLWQPFCTFLTKEPRSVCYYIDKKTWHSQYNELRYLTYYKQSYFKGTLIQIWKSAYIFVFI